MQPPAREPTGAIMTFPGRTPPSLEVPLSWFVRQAATEAAYRLVARFRNALPRLGGN